MFGKKKEEKKENEGKIMVLLDKKVFPDVSEGSIFCVEVEVTPQWITLIDKNYKGEVTQTKKIRADGVRAIID